METLATIRIDGADGDVRGDLYWHEGSIWCCEPGGEAYDTDTPCAQLDAVSTIYAAWGQGWELEYVDVVEVL